MAQKKKNSDGGKVFKSTEKELKFLEKYLPPVQRKIQTVKSMGHGALSQLADQLGIHSARLSEFIRAENPRKLTPYYIGRFIKGGFMTVPQFLQGQKWKGLSVEEREFWACMEVVEDEIWRRLLRKAKEQKVNLREIAQSIIEPRS